MHRFSVIPIESIGSKFQIVAIDAGDVLSIVNRSAFEDFDIWRDGKYAFSVRKHGCAEFWTIFQRLASVVKA